MFSLKNDKTATHVHSADMRAAALTGAICKKNTGMGKILIGRRVSVPQGYFEDIEDDEVEEDDDPISDDEDDEDEES